MNDPFVIHKQNLVVGEGWKRAGLRSEEARRSVLHFSFPSSPSTGAAGLRAHLLPLPHGQTSRESQTPAKAGVQSSTALDACLRRYLRQMEGLGDGPSDALCASRVTQEGTAKRKGKGSRYKLHGLMPTRAQRRHRHRGRQPANSAEHKDQNGFGGTTGFFWFRRCSRQVM